MPTLFLSPSTQEGNLTAVGNSEEYYMNLIADAMEPYLVSNGIRYTRNDRTKTVGQSVRDSNAGNYDLHLAIHSNAAPESLSGQLTGTDVYYFSGSRISRQAAEIIAENFRRIYYQPEKVRTLPTTSLYELVNTRAPAILIETAYHDNPTDAAWIRDNIEAIARNLVEGVTEFFEIPFVEAQAPRIGTVTTAGGSLNIRERPNTAAAVLGTIPNGATITVNGTLNGWYVVNYNDIIGYASAQYITV